MDSRRSRWPLARVALAVMAIGAVVIGPLGCGSGSTTKAPVQPGLAVSGTAVGKPIPSGFVGLSIEIKALEQYAGTDPDAVDPVLLHLIEDIAPEQSPVLRLGGDSTDWSWWPVSHAARPPGVRFTLTPNWMDVAHALATAVRGRLILGIDLEADNRAVAAAEADCRPPRAQLGGRPGAGQRARALRDLRVVQVQPAANRCQAVRVPTTPPPSLATSRALRSQLPDVGLAGPSSGAATWLARLGRSLTAEPRVRLVTVHAYPLKHCSKNAVVTIPELLSNQASHGLAASVAGYVAIANAHRAPLRVDESTASPAGTRGVSDTFAWRCGCSTRCSRWPAPA